MVETSAGGFHQPDFEALPHDIIPEVHNTYNLGSNSKKWAYIYAVIAVLTSITLGGIYLGATAGGLFYVNASTQINGSLDVLGDITASGNITVLGDNIQILDGNMTADFYFGDGQFLTGIQHGQLTLFLHDESSDVTGSKILDTADNDTALLTLSKLITVDGQEYQNWTTNENVPGLPILSDGIYELHFHARVTTTGRKDTTLQFKIYKTNSSGGNPVLVVTSEKSNILTTDFLLGDIHVFGDEIALGTGDRLTLQLIVGITGAGGNPTVEVQIENGIESRIEIPSPSPTKELFIPYTGAVKNINTGNNNITAAYFFGDGSQLSNIAGGNFSWNETRANTLYSGIQWAYNQTLGVTINFLQNILNTTGIYSTFNSTYDAKADYQFLSNNFNGSGNISLEFGEWVSEVNPDGANATRLKATASDVDVVIGDMWGYFNVWNVADNNAVFMVDERGDTDIAGDLTVDKDTFITGNLTLSDELILSQDKSIYFGASNMYYNGTCMIIKGASATMEIC